MAVCKHCGRELDCVAENIRRINEVRDGCLFEVDVETFYTCGYCDSELDDETLDEICEEAR